MSKPGKCVVFLLCLVLSIAILVGVPGLVVLLSPRSRAGRVIRRLRGEAVYTQLANDLAEDVETKIGMEKLQTWAADVLYRYDAGEIDVSHDHGSWDPVPIEILPAKEIPPYLRVMRKESPAVEVHILTRTPNRAGKAECIQVSWARHGILVGPPSYVPRSERGEKPVLYLGKSYLYLRKLKPGVYVYAFEK